MKTRPSHPQLTHALQLACAVLALAAACAQAQPSDTWSNVPQASDDRYTNPKSKVYAGPNGWWNFGQTRALLGGKPLHDFKGGLNSNSDVLMNVSQANKLHVTTLDFGSARPPPGQYTASAKADLAQKKVRVSFSDVNNNKILDWASADKAGVVTVALVNGFTYITLRQVRLEPSAVYNTGDNKQVMTIGFEGALAP